MHSLETHFRFWIFIFLWGRDMWVGPLSWCWAVEVSSNQEKTATTLTAILFFTFCIAFNKLHRYSTLPYYTGSLSEESAQLNVDVVFWGASLVSQTVKNMPAMRETWVWFPDWEDPLEKGMATHSSILAWKISWIEEPGRLQSMGSHRVEHNWATKYTYTHAHTQCSEHV